MNWPELIRGVVPGQEDAKFSDLHICLVKKVVNFFNRRALASLCKNMTNFQPSLNCIATILSRSVRLKTSVTLASPHFDS